MSQLPVMPNVFDYCHSSLRSDWMDIFLLGSARMFVGTSSGPAYVPPVYGVPCVLTNWWPPAQRPWQPQDIFLPKLYRNIKDNQVLSLERSLQEPLGYCNSIDYLNKAEGVVVEDNSADDILAATIEMLDRLDRAFSMSEDDLKLRQRSNEIYMAADVSGMSNLSRDFLRKHRSFLS